MTASLSFPIRPDIERKQHLMALHATVIAYLQAKVSDADWHGVSDAANDLREIEAELRGLRAGD
jgi:hypothetical protein